MVNYNAFADGYQTFRRSTELEIQFLRVYHLQIDQPLSELDNLWECFVASLDLEFVGWKVNQCSQLLLKLVKSLSVVKIELQSVALGVFKHGIVEFNQEPIPFCFELLIPQVTLPSGVLGFNEEVKTVEEPQLQQSLIHIVRQ